jgi:hypothetical protein
LLLAALAWVAEVVLLQFVEGGAVRFTAVALVEDRIVPVEFVLIQLMENSIGCALHFPRWVNILHSDQPFTAMGFGIEVAGQRAHQRTKMQRTGG